MQTATNPDTGETLVLVGEQWQKPEQTATNEKGEKAFLIGGQWVTGASGAAYGNPNIQRQGERALRPDARSASEALGTIAGAGGIGAAIGSVSGEILQGAGRVAGAFPQTRVLGPMLENTGRVLSSNRAGAAISGGISGLASETAGQAVEAAGGPQWGAEVARLAAGSVTPEALKLIPTALYKATGMIPAVADVMAAVRKYTGKEVNLTEAQQRYLQSEIEALRGSGVASDLTGVGNMMGDEAARLTRRAENITRRAESHARNLSPFTQFPQRELADTGGELATAINSRMKAGLEARSRNYALNEKTRDTVVNAKETAGQFVNQTSEFKSLVDGLKADLEPGKRSLDVQTGIKKVLSQLELEEGQITFQALDDVRRKLGDVFRGKPAEGYDAISEGMARSLYKKISEIQESFAGPAQRRLLDDYAARTEGLEVFHSMKGRKATALDKYDEKQAATDPSSLPSTYFKTRASIQTLEELTGSKMLVNKSAMEYANKQLEGATGPEVRTWLGKNSEWLQEVPAVRNLVDRYATRLEGVERSLKNASEFAQRAAKDASILTRDSLPAQRAVDLLKSGSDDLWSKAGPAVAQSAQAKEQTLNAARYLLSQEATSKGTTEFFNNNLRPFLQNSNIATREELDFIAQKLANIRNPKVPEEEILGWKKRILLQAIDGWASSGASRAGAWAKEKVVPD